MPLHRIPEGLKEAKHEWGTVQGKWGQRRDLPMTEVKDAIQHADHTIEKTVVHYEPSECLSQSLKQSASQAFYQV